MDWKSNRKTVNSNKAISIGNKIEFKRKGKIMEGSIVTIRENSVIVELAQDAIDFLGLENELTVVNHANYTVI